MVTVCTKAEVDWAGSGEFTHYLDGAPTVVKLSLDFTELVTLDRKKYDERVSGLVHGKDNKRETTQEDGSLPDINVAASVARSEGQAEMTRLAEIEAEKVAQEKLDAAGEDE